MAPNHTPGPWHVGGKDRTVIFAEDGYAVADTKSFHGKHRDGAAQANAHLIAAAPDLLEFVRDHAKRNPVFAKGFEKQVIADAIALVAKAEGRS